MPRKRTKEEIRCPHFRWLLGRRNGVWFADGRSNAIGLGRHSLGTRDYEQARRVELPQLDLAMAVRHGLADPAALERQAAEPLPLEEGRRLYLEHVDRPRVSGGVKKNTSKKYRSVFDKFLPFAAGRGLACWNRVTAATLNAYAKDLEGRGYAYRTLYVELTTLKQAVGWLVRQGRLPPECKIELRLRKPEGTDTYCWTAAEVRAMLARCDADPGLAWLGAVIRALAFTGQRIGELAALRWGDVDLAAGVLRLVDETAAAHRGGREVRTTKSGKGRSFPIHEELRAVLGSLPRHPDGYVFHGPLGGRLKPDLARRRLISEVLGPLKEAFPTPAGERGFEHGRLHSFRHFFCSLCANRGVPQQTVMSWLGHADSDMVRHYYHLHDEEARRHMARLTLEEAEVA